jgi:tetratricopeptide (TPR) repeat protein
MGRIRLPGRERNKKILLIVLVVIAIGIISNEFIKNINKRSTENKEQEEIVEPMVIEESNNNTTTKDAEEENEDNSKTNDKTKISKQNNYSTKENELYNEAYKLFFSHDYVNAINKADLLINEFPQNAMGYNIRGIAKAYKGDYGGGINDIDNSLNIDPNYGYARFNKALTYELYGKMDEALEWYNKALEVEEYEWSYYGIASIYGRRGDVKNTMTYLNKAIQIDASVKEVAKTEHDFDPVKDSEEFQKAVYN